MIIQYKGLSSSLMATFFSQVYDSLFSNENSNIWTQDLKLTVATKMVFKRKTISQL